MRMHVDQLDVSVELVRELVERQFPQWRTLPIRGVESSGTVNALFRIGTDLAARFPLRPGDPEATRASLESEAEAAGELLGRTRFPTPEPVAIGEPGTGYPLPWSVQTWLPGTVATEEDPGESAEFALDLAEFIRDVRAIDTRGRTFDGRGRGGDLHDHDEWMETCFERSTALLDVPRLRASWAVLRDLPRSPDPMTKGDPTQRDLMTHGDLIPGNVLVAGGRLAGVIDVGGLGPADPALELVAAWHLLEDGPRKVLREALDCGDLEWERGKAWAFEQAMGAAFYYVDTNPAMSRMGVRTLDRIMADTPVG